MIRAAILAAVLMPAQFKAPEQLPSLPPGGAACNETHCLVNLVDWKALNEELKDIRARGMTVQCASVTVIQ